MRPGITAKLFLAILAACAFVVLVYGVAAQIFLRSTFVEYLAEQDAARVAELMPRVEAGYARAGSWNLVRANRDGWITLLHPERAPGQPPRAPPVSDQTGGVFRLALLDRDYEVILGNPDAGRDDVIEPVVVDGETVGWMAVVSFEKVLASAESRFFSAQLRAWWLIGTASVLVAALLGWLLSRTLLRRLRGLAGATHRLAAGDYATRIDSGSPDEIGQLARDFNQLAHALEHNERARRSFMADISHELRTPLAVLRAELEALQDGIRPMTPESLSSLHQQVGQLGQLIEDLHDLSLTDIGALAYRRAPIDLAVVLDTVLDGMRARFAAAGLALRAQLTPGPLLMTGDERRLQQLLANLLENALRYTDAGGEVVVTCTRGPGALRIVVEDSAPGVEADKRARLFERFYRADASRNRASGGSGLGLAICRNIVEAHEGDIVAEASSLGGLRIVLTLPALED
ncbi:sensor histidine kinase efflux regulator BaeS [Luteimonas sp. R10]|uniref:sensor histidine kinase efflux regulator BaeS n=1 Tax=Luteimonas sp. R10 TaxID=3108176 RepID=UPI00308E548A|nr:sensor histidine kinase efflux regulator BaeS [Luteimonas sp. R10]